VKGLSRHKCDDETVAFIPRPPGSLSSTKVNPLARHCAILTRISTAGNSKAREMITRRFATVEPVFGNIRHNKRLNRFTLRGQTKVDRQWKLYCLVHNIEKLAHNGYAR
jgi:hypothetical protein